MKKNRLILFSVPIIAVLSLLLLFQKYASIRKDLAEIRDSQSAKELTLKKYMGLIAQRPDLEKRLAALKQQREAEDTKIMQGQTVSIVSAGLQDTVRTIVTGRGGSILSERAGKAEDVESFRMITVAFDTIMPDARSLSDALYAMETRTPYLVVRDLDVRVRNLRNPRELSVKFEVGALTGTK